MARPDLMFLYDLMAWTGRTLNERAALEEIGEARHLARWQAYARLRRLGGDTPDILAALGARLLNRMAWSADTPAVHPADLMPDRDGRIAEERRRREAQAGEQQLTEEEWAEEERLRREGPDEDG